MPPSPTTPDDPISLLEDFHAETGKALAIAQKAQDESSRLSREIMRAKDLQALKADLKKAEKKGVALEKKLAAQKLNFEKELGEAKYKLDIEKRKVAKVRREKRTMRAEMKDLGDEVADVNGENKRLGKEIRKVEDKLHRVKNGRVEKRASRESFHEIYSRSRALNVARPLAKTGPLPKPKNGGRCGLKPRK